MTSSKRCNVCDKVKRQAKDWRRRNPEKTRGIIWRSKLKRVYGLTENDYEAMWRRQGGRCGLCGRMMIRHGKTRAKASIDHDHVSGRVRGLLCGQCNTVLGHVEKWPVGKLDEWLAVHGIEIEET